MAANLEPERNEDEQRQGAQENVTGPALSAASSRSTPNAGTDEVETGRLQRAALGAGFTINQLCHEAYCTSRDHGFHAPPKAIGEDLALMHSELSEALEEHRDGHRPCEMYYREDGKPEGIPSELADVVIRIADFCGRHGINLEQAILEKCAFNRGRPFKHGRKVL